MRLSLTRSIVGLVSFLSLLAAPAYASEREKHLLDYLLENGSITQEQFDYLKLEHDSGSSETIESTTAAAPAAGGTKNLPAVSAGPESTSGSDSELDPRIQDQVAEAVSQAIEKNFPVKASYGSKGFRLESADGNWQTNLQWRFQFRLTHPDTGDPRQVSSFAGTEKVTFQARRLRMKIGGHGYRPWLKYYFEVDLQPTRDSDESGSDASARVIDWRVDVAKYKKLGLRVGQWKIDYNRERVDSSGRQQFVERSIANRVFTIDRQMGVSVRGHLFEGTPADLIYAFGVFTGEGRGVENDDNNLMYTGRIQWNFLGRDLAFRQTDVERTEKPTASLAFGVAKHTGVCTRWSSSGCGNLDGFISPNATTPPRQGQYRIVQAVQEFAYKHQGFSFQQEFHWKRIVDRAMDNGMAGHQVNLYGGYAQMGYFFNEIIDCFPEELELAFRYAHVREPNAADRQEENKRNEYTVGANWFFSGHNNKLTLDYSHLTLADDVLRRNVSDDRVRFQWDISF